MSVNEVSVQAPERRKYPASVHFAFVAGVLLPLAVIPYALSRRQTSLVRNHLQETERVISGLQKELRTTKRELEAFRDQHTRSSSQIKAVQESVDELTQRSHKLQVEGEEGQKALLQYAVELERDIQSTQTLHTNSMREIGQSLGSIAGFMHELELGLGMNKKGEDPRGIEHIRAIAARLEQGHRGADTTTK